MRPAWLSFTPQILKLQILKPQRAWWLVIALIGMLSSACTKNEPVPTDTLVVALGAQPATLDPRYATDANGTRIASLIFDSLVRLGPKLEPVPEAAERWEFKENRYIFYLRRDLKFHNGRELKAEDVEFSFAQVLAPGNPFASMLDIVRQVTTSEKNGQIVVTVELKNFSDKFLKSDLPSIKLLPKAEVLAADSTFAKTLVGTGPFRLVRQSANEIALDGVAAASKHLRFKVIRDDFTRYQKVLKGEIDIAQMEITPDRIADFKKRPDAFQVFVYPGLSMTYMLVNFRDPILKQKEVRQALAQAIERQDLIRYKMYGLAEEATSILTPRNPYFNPDLKNLPFDLEASRARVKALALDGKELILKTSNAPQAVDNGKVLAYQMSRSGLKVQVQSFEWGTFYSDVKHGNFQLATMRWVGSIDPDIYRMAFHSKEKPPGRNRGSYVNTELDRLLDVGTNMADIHERKKIFAEVQEITQRDVAIIPLWYDEQIAVAKKNVLGYQPNQTGDFRPLTEAYKAHD